jgi:hypothetical protein
MIPALTAVAKTPGKSARRFSVIYVGNGAAPGYFVPKSEGSNWEMPPILEPLRPFRDRLLVLSGIDNPVAMERDGEPRGGHGRIAPAFMTGVHAKPTTGGDFEAGVSVDQIAAKYLGDQTQLASLEVSVDSPEFGGICDTGYSCVYTNTLAWRSPTMPLPMEVNPRAVFERLFGDSGSTDSAVRLARIRERRSVLDSVLDKVETLHNSSSSEDRATLADYLESVREVERRIQKAETQSDVELPVVEQPKGVPSTFDEHVRVLFDLQVLAFRADLTRITTFMLARELSGRTHPDIGVSEGHHALSHHGEKPDKIALLAKVNAYHASLLAYFLEKLSESPDGDGSLLDHSMILYGSGMGNSNRHEPKGLPLLVAGAASGQLAGGRHIRYKEGTRLSNLHLALLSKLGVPVESVGDSTGRLPIDPVSI